MDDPLLVGVLDGTAKLEKQLESLAGRVPMLFAEPGDRHAPDQFHDMVCVQVARDRHAQVDQGESPPGAVAPDPVYIGTGSLPHFHPVHCQERSPWNSLRP